MAIFSENFIKTLASARKLAAGNKEKQLWPEYLLIALASNRGSLAYDILNQLGAAPKKQKNLKVLVKKAEDLPFHKETKKAIMDAALTALKFKHRYIGTEHLLSGLMNLPEKEIKNITYAQFPIEKIKQHLNSLFNSSSHIPNFSKLFSQTAHRSAPDASVLLAFTNDLTDELVQKDINPVLARDKELERMIQILSRKDKNNPVILGDAGVGKTALVEGLAKKIANNEVPPVLTGKRILALDMAGIVAGTMYRGEFEQRLKHIIDEVKNDPDIILFIDELHTIIGSGSASGSLDAANILKPMLARGKIRCIGATTQAEFKKHIEADPALERRFQPVYLNEPSIADAKKMLSGIKSQYQNFHGVNITDDAIDAAVELSHRFVSDKLLPDKAVDLIDEAAAKAKILFQSKDDVYRGKLEMAKDLKTLIKEKDIAVEKENFALAVKIKERETKMRELIAKADFIISLNKEEQKVSITKIDIIAMLAEKTGISATEMSETEYDRLILVQQKLKSIIIGQESAIDQSMRAVFHGELGFNSENAPRAVILFAGTSGVGKTMLAKELAKHLFQNRDAFIQLDMSEYNEKFQSSKLIGAPAGYVGYREGNKFTDLVKKNPHCLVLLDELEKAHSEVLDLFLQIFENGEITDSVGRKINFRDAVIVMTTNALSDKLSKKKLGFGTDANETEKMEFLAELKKHFKPEFINRIGEVVVFNKLDNNHLKDIAIKEINLLTEKLKNKGISFSIDEKALNKLVELAEKEQSAGRALKSVIRKFIEQPMLDVLIKDKKKKITVKIIKNEIVLKS